MKASTKHAASELIKLSLPMAATQFITIGSIFLCMVMVAQLGHDVLAASALIYSARISIIIISGSILFSLSVLVGRAYGEQNYLRIGNYLQQSWLLAILLTIPVMLIYWYIHSIMLFFGQDPALATIVKTFFHANIWNGLPFLLAICNQQMCYGVKKQRIDLIANIFAAGLLIVLSYAMIFGKLGSPQFGVRGLAYAMTIQAFFYFFFTTTVILKTGFFKKFEFLRFRVHQNLASLKEMIVIGWPICIQIGGELLSMFVLAAMVGWLGTEELAAYQIINQYFFLVVVPLFSIAQGTGVLVGQCYGAKQFTQIRIYGYLAVLLTLTLATITAIFFIGMPKQLASFYMSANEPNYQETLEVVVLLFAIVAIYNLFDGVRNVLTGALRGLLDTKYPMYVGISVIWLLEIPLAYVFGFSFGWSVAGILAAGALAMMLGSILVFLRWQKINATLLSS